jgi:ABC-type transport system substrate-binding protein
VQTRVATGEFGPTPVGRVASPNRGQTFLLTLDSYHDYQVVGDTVDSWQFSSDNTKLILHVRPGVKWHDGTTFTANDVAYTLRYYLNPPQGYNTATQQVILSPAVKDVLEVNSETVEVQLKQLSAGFLTVFAGVSMPILPAHLDLDTVSARGIGTGPFKLKNFERDVVVDWERNPDYYLKDEQGRQLPYLDGLRIYQFNDLTLLLAALRTGRIRVNLEPALDRSLPVIKKDIPEIGIDTVVGGTFGFIFKNIPPFTDPRVLEAVSLWMDRKAMVDIGFGGLGWPWDAGMLPAAQGGKWGLPTEEIMSRPGYRYVDASGKLVTSAEEARAKWSELRKDPKDLERAKELLRQAGIKQGDVRVPILNGPQTSTRIAPVLPGQMKELFGTSWTLDFKATSSQVQNDYREGRFAVYSQATGYGVDEPSIAVIPWLWGRGANVDFKHGGWPQDHPVLVKISQLFDQQEFTFDVKKRQELIWELQRAIVDFYGRAITNSSETFDAWWPEFKGYADRFTFTTSHIGARYDRVWIAR